MTTLLAFLVTLGILVIIHEYGHYAAARWMGVKVLRFSVGFGPVMARRCDRRGTEWALSAVPLGGYVKMVDEREGEVAPEDLPYAFTRKTPWQRMIIVAAGPLANFALAILLYWGLYLHGVQIPRPLVGEPPVNTPAALAGIRDGDEITAIQGDAVEDWETLHWFAIKHGVAHEQLVLRVRDPQGHLEERRLDLAGEARARLEEDPLGALGITRFLPDIPPVIGKLAPGGRAESAGLRGGDRILRANGQPIATWRQAVDSIRNHPGRSLALEIQRGATTQTITVTPDTAVEDGQRIGRIGAGPQVDPEMFKPYFVEKRYGVLEAAQRALAKTWDLSAFTLEMMGRMVLGQVSLKNLSGPITIADYAGRSAESGLVAFVAFLALISVSLGVLNLLPVPLLDGGHLLYYLAETITGRPVPDRIQEIGVKIGFALLGMLMFLALFNDFRRLLTG